MAIHVHVRIRHLVLPSLCLRYARRHLHFAAGPVYGIFHACRPGVEYLRIAAEPSGVDVYHKP